MSELRADILREVERAVEDFQPIEVTVDAIMALIEPDKGLQVGDAYEGGEPADCPSVSPDGWFCTEPRGHWGPHLASNGTELVGKWL